MNSNQRKQYVKEGGAKEENPSWERFYLMLPKHRIRPLRAHTCTHIHPTGITRIQLALKGNGGMSYGFGCVKFSLKKNRECSPPFSREDIFSN
jgi:hypothetical protein